MSNPNLKPSKKLAVVGVIDPDANTIGEKLSAFVDMGEFEQVLAIIQTGILGAGATIDAKLQEAQDAAGLNVKDIAGKAITQLVKATDDDVQALINIRSDELDVNNDFNFVRLSLEVGTATSDSSAVLLGLEARYQPADADNKDLASVVEKVG